MSKQNLRNRAGSDDQELTLRDMLMPLFRHRRIVIGTFCVLFVAAILLAWLWASQYYVSKMQVVVEQDRSDPTVSAGQNAAVLNNKSVTLDQVTSEMALLQGDDMLRTVAATCHLGDDPSMMDVFLPSDPAQRRSAKQESAARRLGKKLKIEAEKTSDVIDVSYGRVGDPHVPACVLQNLSQLYIEKHLQLLRPVGSSDFFAAETEKYRKALEDAEAKLTSFSEQQGVAAPDILRTDMAQQVAVSEAALNVAEQNAAADQQRIADLNEQMGQTPARSATAESAMAANLLLENLNATLLTAEVKRTQLLMKYDPSYPLVVEVDQEIAETKSAIAKADAAKYVNTTTDRDPTYEFLREDKAKTEADLASAKATAATLVTNIKSMRTQMVDLDSKAVAQAALIREQKAAEANYLLYLTKREEERTSDALDKRGIANVAIAVAPTLPVLPEHSPLLVLVLGFVGALLVSVGAGYLAEHLDPSLRTPEDVAQTLSIPVLASVPRRKVA